MSPIDILETVALVWFFISLIGVAFLLVAAVLTSQGAPEEEHLGAPTVPFTGRISLPNVDERPLEPGGEADVEMTDAHIARRLEVVRRQNEVQQ